MPANPFRKPWQYEPLAITRERALASFDTLRDEISPLVANGDMVSLLKAMQATKRAQKDPKQAALNKRSMMQKVGERARKALEEARRNETEAAPPEVQQARDVRASIIQRQGASGRPIPGVPRGVSEAQPSAVRPTDRVYDSSTTASSEVIKRGIGAVNTPLVRGRGGPLEPLVEEATRPSNLLLGAAGPGISSAARSVPVLGRPAAAVLGSAVEGGLGKRLIGEAATAAGARIGAEQLQNLVPEDANPLLRGGAALAGGLLGGGIGAGSVGGSARVLAPHKARVGEALRGAGETAARGATAYRDITKNIPIGASIKDVGGEAPEGVSPFEAARNALKRDGIPKAPIPSGATIGGGASRVGNRLLQLPDTGQLTAELGRVPELKEIFRVDRQGRREATAQANRLRSQAQLDFRALGDTVKDSKGNLLVRGIAPDAKDIARGQQFAPLLKVLEKPGSYALTPEQSAAATRLASIPELVRTEREAFGVGPRILDVDPAEQFIWRKAKVTSKGVETNKPRPSAGGSRLGGGGEKARVFEDIDDALDAGVVYAHPQEAFDQNILTGLKKSVDEHIKGMLVPMSDSAAQRVSPGMRARNDYLNQRLTSLKGTLGRLDARTRATVDAYVNSASPDLDALYDELGHIASRTGKLPPQVADELKQTMADIRAMKPAWRRELRNARAVPAGRATVPMDVAPALSGRDFDPQVAQKIEDYYRRTARIPLPRGNSISLRADVPAVRAVSAALTPIRATGDFSAILMNQVTNIARHPLTFSKNVALGFRDMVDDTHYNQWLADPARSDAARHGVAIAGEAGEPLELQFSNWMQRFPGIKQVNNHYVRLNNRQRVDLYNQAVKAAGKNVTDADKEAIARSVNRFTGVSANQATDAETIASFAPEFTRAHIETIAKALSDGGIEGKMARESLATMLGAGGMLVTGVALAQGRDPREVLAPVDMEALHDGRVKLNPNFMSVRVAGQDVKIFGKYDSLMRLLAVTETGLADAIGERDAMNLFDPVGYYAGGMGSPVASFLTSLIKGETFAGDDPLSLKGLASNITPFTLPEAIGELGSAGRNAAQGDIRGAASDVAAAGILLAGGKASPVTASEQLDQKAKDLYGKSYWDLDPDIQKKLQVENPELYKQTLEHASDQRRDSEETKQKYRDEQLARDERLLAGRMPREQWLELMDDARNQKAGEMRRIWGEEPITKPRDAREKYVQAIQQATDPESRVTDWEQVDAKVAGFTQEERDFIDRTVGLDETPVASLLRDVRKVYSARKELPLYRGYSGAEADEIDTLWQEVRNNARSAERIDMSRALRAYKRANPGLDPRILRGVTRRIMSGLPKTTQRARFDKKHPELKLFYGEGTLTAAERAAIQSLIAQREKAA